MASAIWKNTEGCVLRILPQTKYFLILPLCLLVVSCSKPKTISQQELRSDLLSATSLASESELFMAQLQENRTTKIFAKAHIHYLHEEATRDASTLHQVRTNKEIAEPLRICREQLLALASVLADLEQSDSDTRMIPDALQRTTRIKLTLEQAETKL